MSLASRLAPRIAMVASCTFLACGASEPSRAVEPVAIARPSPAPSAAADAGTTETTAGSGRTYAYVQLRDGWGQSLVRVTADEVNEWAKLPTNAASLLPGTRHILIRVAPSAPPAEQAAARKKAELALKRVQKGEDFAKVARELSEDPGSKDRGGAFPGSAVPNFVEEYRNAYAALAPGETAKQLVRTAFGWHVIRKDAADDAAKLDGYQAWKARELSRSLAEKIAARARASGPSVELERAVEPALKEVLGDTSAGADTPTVYHLHVAAEGAAPGTSDCERRLDALQGGGVVVGVQIDGKGSFVATVHPETARERDERIARSAAHDGADEHGGLLDICDEHRMTGEQMRRLLERMRAQQQSK